MSDEHVNYDNARKENWRNWQWNLIEKWIKKRGIRRRDARILYLRGKEPADYETALDRGFKRHNLFAIDTVKDRVRDARNHGENCIFGNINDMARRGYLLDADCIIADFCAGMKRHVQEFSSLMRCNNLIEKKKSVLLCVNLQRGRDPEWSEMNETYQREIREFADTLRDRVRKENVPLNSVPALSEYYSGGIDKDYHRGFQFYLDYYMRAFLWMAEDRYDNETSETAILTAFLREYLESGGPRFKSYRSSNNNSSVRMDSVVFCPSRTRMMAPHSFDYDIRYGMSSSTSEATLRSARACKAIATMRSNGS